MTRYIETKENKTVLCVITARVRGQKVTVKAFSNCAPDDTFNLERGKRLAHIRAMIKLKKKEVRIIKAEADQIEKQLAPYLDKMETSFDKAVKKLDELQKELEEVLNTL